MGAGQGLAARVTIVITKQLLSEKEKEEERVGGRRVLDGMFKGFRREEPLMLRHVSLCALRVLWDAHSCHDARGSNIVKGCNKEVYLSLAEIWMRSICVHPIFVTLNFHHLKTWSP